MANPFLAWQCTDPNPLLPLPLYHTVISSVIPTSQLTLSSPHFFLISDMGDQSGSSRLQALFELALRDYESTTNITLAKHPLAEKLGNCHSVETIVALLQDQAKEFRGSDRIMRSIGSTVSVLDQLSTTSSLSGAIGLVRQIMLRGFHKSLILS